MLSRIAVRLATIGAIKGRTLVGDNVLDSQIGVLDVDGAGALRTEAKKPFIAVYVDSSEASDQAGGRSLHRAGLTELVIEYGIATTMAELNQETGETVLGGIGIPATDAAMEFYLDSVGRQIANGLSDPDNAWAEIWRGLSNRVVRVDRRRASDAEGVRIAAQQMVLTLDLLSDPVFGEEIADTSIWARLLAAMQEENHPYLASINALLGSGAEGADQGTRRRYGLTLEELTAMLAGEMSPGATIQSVTTSGA